jgi:hypothetical protein
VYEQDDARVAHLFDLHDLTRAHCVDHTLTNNRLKRNKSKGDPKQVTNENDMVCSCIGAVTAMLRPLGIFCMTRVRFGCVKRVAGGACALHFHFAQDLRCGLRQPSRPSLAPLSISGGHFGRPAN